MNDEPKVLVSDDFYKKVPKAKVGIMVLQVADLQPVNSAIDHLINHLINGERVQLKTRFPDSSSIRNHPVIQAYSKYYKKFKKTYHLIAQLESAVLHNKPIKLKNPVLQLIYIAELKNMLLTAVHDLDTVLLPIRVSVASGSETYFLLNGSEKQLKPNDMCMLDRSGVISSVIYGPDHRTRVIKSTRNFLVVIYAPEKITSKTINIHFNDILDFARILSPSSKVNFRAIFPET